MTIDDGHPEGAAPGFGMFGDLLAQFEVATERLENAAEEARSAVVEGSAAGGAVRIELSGELEAVSVRIDPSLVDPNDVGMLEDSVLAALRDALGQVAELQQEVAETLGGGGIDLSALISGLGGLALPGLGNLADLGNLGIPEHMPGGGGLGGGLGALLAGFAARSGDAGDAGDASAGDADDAGDASAGDADDADDAGVSDDSDDPDEAAGRA